MTCSAQTRCAIRGNCQIVERDMNGLASDRVRLTVCCSRGVRSSGSPRVRDTPQTQPSDTFTLAPGLAS